MDATITKTSAVVSSYSRYSTSTATRKEAADGASPGAIVELGGEDAVAKGFAEVTDMLGGELPEISRQTYDLVRQGFGDWAKELGIANSQAADGAAG